MNEIEFVEILKKSFLKNDELLRTGIGDDCAIIQGPKGLNYLITGDGLNEESHFLKNESLEMVFSKLFVRNISDIYAMGGVPKFGMIFSSMKKDDTKNSIPIIKKLSKTFNINIIGGDFNYSAKKRLTMIIIGIQKERYLYKRSNAKIGDNVYLSGYTGLSYFGLKAIKENIDGFEFLKNHYHYFSLPKKKFLARYIENKDINSAIDISDGLIADAQRIASGSNVRLHLEQKNIPIHKEIRKFADFLNINPNNGVISGGDDYEILFTSPKILDFAHLIGEVIKGKGVEIDHLRVKNRNDYFN